MYMKLLLFAAKTSSCLNPIVFAISHPKFREAIAKEIPCLGIGKQHLNLRAFIKMKYAQVVVWYDLIVYRGQAKRLWLKQHRGSEDRNMLVEPSQNFRTCFFIKSILLLNLQMSFCFVQIRYLTLSCLFVKWLKTIALNNVLMLNVQTLTTHYF